MLKAISLFSQILSNIFSTILPLPLAGDYGNNRRKRRTAGRD